MLRSPSGVGIYTKHAPSAVRVGFDGGEFDQEGRYVELRFDTPARKFSVISSYFPSGTTGELRQAAKYRFLDAIYTHLNVLKKKRDFVAVYTRRQFRTERSAQSSVGAVQCAIWLRPTVLDLYLASPPAKLRRYHG
jgi:hypothetical protein